MDTLEAVDISWHCAGKLRLKQITTRLKPGELVSLIGPNGAGKSSLLKVLSGYQHPTSGECQLAGRALSAWNTAQLARKRAVMRQQVQLTFPCTARQVIELGRVAWQNQNHQQVITEVAALTECSDLLAQPYQQLSGGEQQRLHLARVLAQLWQPSGPEGWLLLDEPTSALDLFYQQHLLRLLRRLTRQFALSICIVLHDLNLASLWSDRILLMHDGALLAEGSPASVLTKHHLQTAYSADLLVTQAERPQVMLCQ
jgi:iron complex transport system ATP-binding protein